MLQILFFAPEATPNFPGVGYDRETCVYLIFRFVRRTILVGAGRCGRTKYCFTFVDNYLFIFSGLCL